MKKIFFAFFTFSLVGFVQAQVFPNYGGERAGLSALNFLKNDISPRSVGMGGASVALNGDGYSIFNNPAALADLDVTNYTLSNYFLGAGGNQSFVAAMYPNKRKTGTFAASINALNSGSIQERTEFQPNGTGREFNIFNMAVGLTYAQKLSEQFSLGVTLKYVYENIADFTNHTAGVDIAFLYKTDFKDLQFAVMLSNFGGNSALANNNKDLPVDFNRSVGISLEDNTLPSVFSLGVSAIPWRRDKQSILTAFQINHPNDNSENIRLGLEYNWADIFFARAGYKISVQGQNWPTAGIGVRAMQNGRPLYIDYSINPTTFVGTQHIIGLRFALLNDNR